MKPVAERSSVDRRDIVFPPRPTRAQSASLRRRLLAWYDAHQRSLPWRVDRDPYRVWISEAMLQQTRVETVIPYYARFLARFPNLAALAAAPVEDVLAAWSGLGYYSRARTLHSAAHSIVREYGGRVPDDRERLLALPGIGPYTAGAILSIAFDRPEPLIDGNVARVFSRLFELADEASSPRLARELWSRATELVAACGRAGDWNQALMELGALVCTPRDPLCTVCPLASACGARRTDRVSELPWPKARRRTIGVELAILVVQQRGRLLVEQRPATGRMAGLWQLPTIEVVPSAPGTTDGKSLLFPARWPSAIDQRGRKVPALRAGTAIGAVSHTITHHRIRATVHSGTLAARRIAPPFVWLPVDEVGALPLTGMARKVLRAHFLPRARGKTDGARSRVP